MFDKPSGKAAKRAGTPHNHLVSNPDDSASVPARRTTNDVNPDNANDLSAGYVEGKLIQIYAKDALLQEIPIVDVIVDVKDAYDISEAIRATNLYEAILQHCRL